MEPTETKAIVEIGIDFGTTRSLICKVGKKGCVMANFEGSPFLASVVHFFEPLTEQAFGHIQVGSQPKDVPG